MPFAEVALNVPLRKTFTYHIPDAFAGQVLPGCLARVEFGVAMQPGLVLALHDESPIPRTKPLIELLDPLPVLSPAYLDLARWLSESCLAPIGACLWLMLPPGFTGKSDQLYRFLRDDLGEPQQLSLPGAPKQPPSALDFRLLEYLRDKGPKRLSQLKRAFAKEPLTPALERLTEAGMLSSEAVLAPPSVKAKTRARLHPQYRVEQIPDLIAQLRKPSKQAELLELIAERDADAIGLGDALKRIGAKSKAPLKKLIDEGLVFVEETERGEQDLIILEAPPERVERALSAWRGEGYLRQLLLDFIAAAQPMTMKEATEATGASRARLKGLVEAGALELRDEILWRDSLRDFDFVPSAAPSLTPDQRAAWNAIRPTLQGRESARYLLHGVTGSGKTEIYLRAIAETLRQGRAAILLVPEIALTPQTVRRVAERFPGRVALVHGSLPAGERYDAWQRARKGEIGVIVGTRSALFTPLPDIGLIALDEEHDASYKQAPGMNLPVYHSREAAEQLARRHGAALILGSATPDLGTWHRARQGHYQLLRLPQRIMGHRQRIAQQADRLGLASRYQSAQDDALAIELPPVEIVDMRAELRAGNTSMFSRALQRSLGEVLARGEQAMLLLNRRGHATYVFCRDCGFVLECSRCDAPLTYHRVDRHLRCHHCGASEPQPAACPACQSPRVRYFGAGTQQVAEALNDLYPAVRSLRWDIDSARSPQTHFEILRKFIDREADVLIGTQMIAKGLDLPLVTLVGVVSADLGLALPDYRAGERVFQLLTQVSGRAGRGLLGGSVVLQTYQPGHYVVQAASQHDYAAFVERESAYRRELGYPPYRRLARLVFAESSPEAARRQAEEAARRLRQILQAQALTGTTLIGPAPCFFARLDRRYRWHLLLRGPDPRAALRELKPLPGWRVDIDPVDLL